MTQQQQPFSRPGAVDLSSFSQAAPAAPAGGGGAASGGSAYSVRVDGEQSLQAAVEASMTAPVVLAFVSPSRVPESGQMAQDLATVVAEHEGRFLAAVVDVDAAPAIAQMMQIQQVPLMMVLVDGRPATQPIPGVAGLEDLRTMLTQLAQQLTAQGMTGRHQPRTAAPEEGEQGEDVSDPRYAAAEAALQADDIDGAVAEYQKLLEANPADAEAAAGLSSAQLLQRTRGVDLQAAREAAAARPDDVAAQTMVADLDLLGGHVDDAFGRLIELVRRTSGKERDAAREHLLLLFGAVGNEDPRVLKGRQQLASALF